MQKSAFGIHLCNFILFSETPRTHTNFQLLEVDTGIRFTDQLQLHIVEIPKYRPGGAMADDLEKLVFGFTFEEEDGDMKKLELPFPLRGDPVFEMMERKYQEFNSDEKLRAYAQSREKGIKEGRAEGERQGKREVARKLLERGLSPEEIFSLTGISSADL